MPARGLLLAIDYPPAGGGISRLLESWTVDTEEIEWRVFTSTPGPESERVVRTSLRAMGPAAVSRGRPWLRRVDERVVVAGHPYLAGLAVAVAKMAGGRSACTAYGQELVSRGLTHRLALSLLALTNKVVAISSYSAGLARSAGARQSCLSVVWPELRAPWLATSPPRRNGTCGLRLVALTRLNEGYKNAELLLRLCAVLRPVGVVEDLTIIGGGPRLDALGEKAASLGVAEVVELPGHIPDENILGILANSHVGLFPSRNSIAEQGFEGFGLVVHELAAAGLPVLVGAAGGAVDAARDPWAWLLDPDDLWGWVDAIERLHANEDMRLAMGEAALVWASAVDPLESAREFARALLGGPAENGEETKS